MPEVPAIEHAELPNDAGRFSYGVEAPAEFTSLRAVFGVMIRRRVLVMAILGALLLVCLVYCLLAPREYDARARVALRATGSPLSQDPEARSQAGSELTSMVHSETVAGILRSDRLAWQVILGEKLYAAPAFKGRFGQRFPRFRPEVSDPEAQNFLLERFQDRLHVETLPRSMLIDIRFRSRDPWVSAAVVNQLIAAYGQEEAEQRIVATEDATRALQAQLRGLKARAEDDNRRLTAYQKRHDILIAPEMLSNGASTSAGHLSAVVEVDELEKEFAAADSERLLREAEYRAAARGDPEGVLAFDPRMSVDGNDLSSSFRQLHARRSELEQEQAQLGVERGPNFPQMIEIRQQLLDLDRQIDAKRTALREQFRSALRTAEEREMLIHRELQRRRGEGQKAGEAAAVYAGMRREADATLDLYVRMQGKVDEAELAARAYESDIWVVDEARVPSKPAAPDLPLYMAMTFSGGLWIAGGVTLLVESRARARVRALFMFLAFVVAMNSMRGQAPTPSTSGLPTGVARIPQSGDNKVAPEEKADPAMWGRPGTSPESLSGTPPALGATMPAPIAPGDLLDIGEFHTPEFHSIVHVSTSGTVKLPMIDEVRVEGMNELEAASVIAAALVSRGILNHPQVSLLVTAAVGQDVSVLGEVGRPGIYPYTVHHRLFDMISAASGLSPAAGGVVNLYHRGEPSTPHAVRLDPNGGEAGADGNPEIAPGDIVQVTRAGLVYVVGDVIRPGGFIVDPTQEFTVLKALSLAWGPSQNAAVNKALLIREQSGGRTVTSLNLKRMLRGKDPDQPIRAHDILFVPDSAAKNLFNRSIESAIQSAAGVSIYSGLVYSQRF